MKRQLDRHHGLVFVRDELYRAAQLHAEAAEIVIGVYEVISALNLPVEVGLSIAECGNSWMGLLQARDFCSQLLSELHAGESQDNHVASKHHETLKVGPTGK